MSTKEFDFKVRNSLNQNIYHNISVSGSQCEIDAGFESSDYLLILEAKNYKVKDFLVRQLYYPYRLWKNKTQKEVIPILMTYQNSEFSFFIFTFEDEYNYNSIRLLEQKNYIIRPEDISREDISEIFYNIQPQQESKEISFPQADNFSRILELLSLLKDNVLSREDIRDNYEFDMRQVSYYTDAARYLGLVNKDTNSRTIYFNLTFEGDCILEHGYKQKILSLIQKILEHQVFYEVFELTLNRGCIPDKEDVCKIMSLYLDLSQETIARRSRTVSSWIRWILNQMD
jgi:hypothetical protein